MVLKVHFDSVRISGQSKRYNHRKTTIVSALPSQPGCKTIGAWPREILARSCVAMQMLLEEIELIDVPPLIEIENDMGDESKNVRNLEAKVSKLEADRITSHAFELLASRTQDVTTAIGKIETGCSG